MITKDFGFLILFEFYLLCFLMKTAVAIPLKKLRKINVFLRGSCFRLIRSLFIPALCRHHDNGHTLSRAPAQTPFLDSAGL